MLEPGYNWPEAIMLVEPMRKEMYANTRQMGRDLGDRGARGTRWAPCRLARAPLPPIEAPLQPQPIDLADTHRDRDLPLGDRVEQDTTRALRLLVE